MNTKTAPAPQAEAVASQWAGLSADARADLLKNSIPHPSETAQEARSRLKNDLQLYDDTDICALLDVSPDTMARHRVSGTGPTPIRVNRAVFYDRQDVRAWMQRHRDVADGRKGR